MKDQERFQELEKNKYQLWQERRKGAEKRSTNLLD